MALEFRPTIKSINIASEDLTKITLEVKNGSLDGKYDELRKFSNKTVNITIVPEYYGYTIPYDNSTNQPTMEYKVNNDGTIDLIKQEQTQLEVDEQGNIDIEERPFTVTKEIVDEFIMKAKSLEFPGEINPRDVLIRIDQNEALSEIGEDYGLAEISVINELEKAREYYAPYAAAWDKKRSEVVFEEPKQEVESEETAQDEVAEETETTEDQVAEDSEETTEQEENETDPY